MMCMGIDLGGMGFHGLASVGQSMLGSPFMDSK